MEIVDPPFCLSSFDDSSVDRGLREATNVEATFIQLCENVRRRKEVLGRSILVHWRMIRDKLQQSSGNDDISSVASAGKGPSERERDDLILSCRLFLGRKEMHPEVTHRCAEETNGPVEKTTS